MNIETNDAVASNRHSMPLRIGALLEHMDLEGIEHFVSPLAGACPTTRLQAQLTFHDLNEEPHGHLSTLHPTTRVKLISR